MTELARAVCMAHLMNCIWQSYLWLYSWLTLNTVYTAELAVALYVAHLKYCIHGIVSYGCIHGTPELLYIRQSYLYLHTWLTLSTVYMTKSPLAAYMPIFSTVNMAVKSMTVYMSHLK